MAFLCFAEKASHSHTVMVLCWGQVSPVTDLGIVTVAGLTCEQSARIFAQPAFNTNFKYRASLSGSERAEIEQDHGIIKRLQTAPNTVFACA